MSYLQTIEFLVKEVAKKDQEIKSLSIAVDSKSTLVKDLEALSDKRLEYLVAKRDEAEDLEATLELTEHRLNKTIIEKDHWKEEANKYKSRLSNLNDVIVKSDAAYEAKIAKLQVEINHLKHNK